MCARHPRMGLFRMSYHKKILVLSRCIGFFFCTVQQKFIAHLCGLQLINITVDEIWFQRMLKVAVCSIDFQFCMIDGIGKELGRGL